MSPRYFLMFFGLLLAGCKQRSIASLPGTYVNGSASSYSRAFDTLVITKEGDDGNLYSVDRSASFNRIRHGKLQSKQYQLEHWIGIYDDRMQTLTDTKKGRVLTYIPEKKKLLCGNTVYLKIK